MPELRVPPAAPGADGAITVVTPKSAGWSHVGFEALVLEPGRTAVRDTGARECCVVVIGGHIHIRSAHGDWRDVGGRATPFDGAPDAAYLPPRTRFTVEGAEDGDLPVDDGSDYAAAPVDLAANAESLGARVLRARTIAELRDALGEARAHAGGPVVVHVETDRYEGVSSYGAWWDVPVAAVGGDDAVRAARAEYDEARRRQRAYVTAAGAERDA